MALVQWIITRSQWDKIYGALYDWKLERWELNRELIVKKRPNKNKEKITFARKLKSIRDISLIGSLSINEIEKSIIATFKNKVKNFTKIPNASKLKRLIIQKAWDKVYDFIWNIISKRVPFLSFVDILVNAIHSMVTKAKKKIKAKTERTKRNITAVKRKRDRKQKNSQVAAEKLKSIGNIPLYSSSLQIDSSITGIKMVEIAKAIHNVSMKKLREEFKKNWISTNNYKIVHWNFKFACKEMIKNSFDAIITKENKKWIINISVSTNNWVIYIRVSDNWAWINSVKTAEKSHSSEYTWGMGLWIKFMQYEAKQIGGTFQIYRSDKWAVARYSWKIKRR